VSFWSRTLSLLLLLRRLSVFQVHVNKIASVHQTSSHFSPFRSRYTLTFLRAADRISHTMAALEAAALSGELFQPRRSPSPARSLSTASEPNTDDELGSDLSRPTSTSLSSHNAAPSRGGAQTGPKGVINDRDNQRHSDRLAQSAQRLQIVESQKKKTMLGVTSVEEDDLREKERLLKESEEEAIAREQWRAKRRAEMEKVERDGGEENHRGHRRGGLREVGKEGFLTAVEKRGWTVVLIYEPVRLVTLSN
jgi:hypothetical protein